MKLDKVQRAALVSISKLLSTRLVGASVQPPWVGVASCPAEPLALGEVGAPRPPPESPASRLRAPNVGSNNTNKNPALTGFSAGLF